MRPNLVQHVLLRARHQIDGRALAAVARTAAHTVDVGLLVLKRGHIEVEHHAHRLNVNAARQQVRRNEDTGLAGAELVHAALALHLGHRVTIDEPHGIALLRQHVMETVRALLRIREDDGMGNADALEDIRQHIELLAVILQLHVELLDAV